MWVWLRREAETIQAVAALATVAATLIAVWGVVMQVKASRDLAALQSARDAYRGHLALAVTVPDLAAPEAACTLMQDPRKAPAYDAFVAHLLYAAEQMLEQRPDWDVLFQRELEPHLAYLCRYRDDVLTDDPLDALLTQIVTENCAQVPACP